MDLPTNKTIIFFHDVNCVFNANLRVVAPEVNATVELSESITRDILVHSCNPSKVGMRKVAKDMNYDFDRKNHIHLCLRKKLTRILGGFDKLRDSR